MKFSKKRFNDPDILFNTYLTSNHAVIKVERPTPFCVGVTIDNQVLSIRSLRETAILFLKMAEHLDDCLDEMVNSEEDDD